ncbi:nucleoside diphosphate kinase Ndk1 [Coemansia nantahalensis]|uniref:Nucleoside diphosphate kinase Ndk1 n=1 Tax=Coemansia nantahalensis TaxID=2789366 RepID=A0ACC1JVA6_9FUNG|nr:nucleoside diphosphate kinase Ndk1 [Coemansia nantahalensis]
MATSSRQALRSNAARFGAAVAVGAAVSFAFTLYGNSKAAPTLHADSAVPIYGVPGTAKERTFIAVKPDGVQRGLVSDIIGRFERRGYKLVGLKLLVPSVALAKEHYADLSSKPFFAGLVDYMTNGKAPVVGMVWEGPAVIKQGRVMLGATDPKAAGPGTIRGDYCLSIGRNICHGSDSAESAEKEISLWFGGRGEVVSWASNNDEWVVSDN